MKMYGVLIVICLGYCATEAFAQENVRPRNRAHLAVYYGYHLADNSPVASVLPIGMPAPADNNRSITVSAGLGRGWTSLGFDLWANFGHGPENDSLNAALSGVGILADFAYKLIHSRVLSIQPRIGVGRGSATLLIRRKSNPTQDDIRQFRGEKTKICIASWLLDIGLGADICLFSRYLDVRPGFHHSGDNRQRVGLELSLQAGYLHGFASGEWNHNGHDLGGTPEYSMSGFYVRLGLGYFEESSKPF